MSGIALMIGAEGDRFVFGRMMYTVAHRGDSAETLLRDGLLAGVSGAVVADGEPVVQPWCSPDGQWLLCYDGTVVNHRELRAELRALGREFHGDSDAEVVLEAFRHWGEQAVTRLRGEYAFVIVQRPTGRTYLARDPLGVKPLYWATRAGRLHVGSEIKALVPVQARIREVPAGAHGWAERGRAPQLSSFFELSTVDTDGSGPTEAELADAAGQVRAAIAASVAQRVPASGPVGVLLSGGLSSAVMLAEVRELRPDCVAFTVGAPGSPDLDYAGRLAAWWGVAHEVVEVRPREIGYDEIREAIRVGELTEYGDIIDAVITVPLLRRARERGVRVVLAGDGGQELFGVDPVADALGTRRARELSRHRLANLTRTELQRVDRTAMAFGVSARVPLLDPAVLAVALRQPLSSRTRYGLDRALLRAAYREVLPEFSLDRPHAPMAVATGLAERARLFKPIFARLHRTFGYDLLEPIRRDFDAVLTACDNDLSRALVEQANRQDHTFAEHARDLVGAVRINAKPLWRRISGPTTRPTRAVEENKVQ